MTTPTKPMSYTSLWLLKNNANFNVTEIDSSIKIIQEHLSQGWSLQEVNEEEIIFTTNLNDGRRWTRHYSRKTATYEYQRFYRVNDIAQRSVDENYTGND